MLELLDDCDEKTLEVIEKRRKQKQYVYIAKDRVKDWCKIGFASGDIRSN